MIQSDLSKVESVVTDIDLADFRRTMGSFASGVTIVTSSYEGTLYALTLSAFVSLSSDPPLVLVCIDKQTAASAFIEQAGIFAVNVLSSDQEQLSRCFASRSQERYESFCHANYTSKVTGAPILEGSVAYADCRLVTTYEGGDHTIYIGQIVALGTGDATPLLYYRGAYHTLAPTK